MTDDAGNLVGHHIDHFHVLGLLGEGGMGVVYQARDLQLDRHVALKIIANPEPTARARFEREARALARLNHPNVAQIYWLGTYAGRPYFAMELLAGPTVAELIARAVAEESPVPVSLALRYLEEAASGLAAAHTRQLVHRDVKPSNLMLDEHQTLKVVDFGLARHTEDDAGLTGTHLALGTPRYMAPEVALGQRADHRSDIYSLGATFYHLLALEPPFQGTSALSLMLHQVQSPPRPLRGVRQRLQSALPELVDRMLAKDPGARPQTYEELLRTIRRLRANLVESPAADLPWVLASGVDATLPSQPAAPHTATALEPTTPTTSAPTPRPRPKSTPRASAVGGPIRQRAEPSSWTAWLLLAIVLAVIAFSVYGWLSTRSTTGEAHPITAAQPDAEAHPPPADEPPGSFGEADDPTATPAEPTAPTNDRPSREPDASDPVPERRPLRDRLPTAPELPPGEAPDPRLMIGLALRAKTQANLQRARVAIEVYIANQNRLPTSLEEATAGELDPEALTDGWGQPLMYQPLVLDAPNPGDRYQLFSVGPDGQPGTGDDVAARG